MTSGRLRHSAPLDSTAGFARSNLARLKSREPANIAAEAAVQACQEQGLIVQARGSQQRKNVIRLVPPMDCTDGQIDEGMAILNDVVARVKRA